MCYRCVPTFSLPLSLAVCVCSPNLVVVVRPAGGASSNSRLPANLAGAARDWASTLHDEVVRQDYELRALANLGDGAPPIRHCAADCDEACELIIKTLSETPSDADLDADLDLEADLEAGGRATAGRAEPYGLVSRLLAKGDAGEARWAP